MEHHSKNEGRLSFAILLGTVSYIYHLEYDLNQRVREVFALTTVRRDEVIAVRHTTWGFIALVTVGV